MPRDLYNKVKQDIPKEIGVLVENKIGDKIYEYSPLICVKKSIKQELKVDKDILKNSLIRSLFRESNLGERDRQNRKIEFYENLIKAKDNELNELKYALFDMVNQFAEDEEGRLYTKGLSALENAFYVLDIDEGIENKKLWKIMQRYNK